jgi:hypothetical protein
MQARAGTEEWRLDERVYIDDDLRRHLTEEWRL